jgi:tetratricopeptide (TPR) repeat protein
MRKMATKKTSGKGKEAAAKLNNQKATMGKKPQPSNEETTHAAKNAKDVVDAQKAFHVSLQYYEQALKALQAQKFDKAKPLLEKVVSTGPKDLADRARMHLSICDQQLSKATNRFNSVEEHYDYAVSLMNMGDFVTAREHLEKIVNQSPKLHFVWYGLAILECLTGHTNESLQHLAEAIKLNPRARFQARNDSDFKNMADDPRFTELLYPEGATA